MNVPSSMAFSRWWNRLLGKPEKNARRKRTRTDALRAQSYDDRLAAILEEVSEESEASIDKPRKP